MRPPRAGRRLRPMEKPELERLRVADAMHHGILTCPPATPLRTVAKMMAGYGVHCIAVFVDIDESDEDGRLWGIVSDLDLVGAAAEGVEERTAYGTAASPLVTVTPDETLARASRLMRDHGTAHLVVVDPASDQPLGVLSTLDVARALAGS